MKTEIKFNFGVDMWFPELKKRCICLLLGRMVVLDAFCVCGGGE